MNSSPGPGLEFSLVRGKSLLRAAYETPFAAPIRLAHLSGSRVREASRTQKISQQNSFHLLTRHRLRELPGGRQSVCFILGAGASVNELTSRHFAQMSSEFSIGINSWVSHEFTPNVYSFEADGLAEAQSPEIIAMSRALAKKAQRRPHIGLLLLRPKRADLQHRMVDIPPIMRDRALMYGRYNLHSRSVSNLRQDLRSLLRAERRKPLRLPAVVDNGASVARMLTLSALMGFKKTVLVGVDLNSNNYFWTDSPSSSTNKDLARNYPRGSGVIHKTLSTVDRPFSNLFFVAELARALNEVFSLTTYVASRSSALAEDMPLYDWSGN